MRFNPGQTSKKLPNDFYEIHSAHLKTKDNHMMAMMYISHASYLKLQNFLAIYDGYDPVYFTVNRITNELLILPAPTKRVDIELRYTSINRI